MNYETELKAVLAKHDGLSKGEVTLALLLARVEQVYHLQLEARIVGKLPQDREQEAQKMERLYLRFLDTSLGVVRDPMAGIFPSFPGESGEAP